MRTALTLLLAICIQSAVMAAGVEIQDPALTITGHYRDTDGRVSEHKFPTEIKLLANGTFTGTIELWIEERLTNGTSHLDYFNNTFSGIWRIKSQTIHITVTKGSVFPGITFQKFNGLKIAIAKKDS